MKTIKKASKVATNTLYRYACICNCSCTGCYCDCLVFSNPATSTTANTKSDINYDAKVSGTNGGFAK